VAKAQREVTEHEVEYLVWPDVFRAEPARGQWKSGYTTSGELRAGLDADTGSGELFYVI
jgi:hypothetical protein